MKTQNTQTEINNVIAALAAMHIRPFNCESSDPTYDAQRNLSGKTFYYDTDTLKWHKSRVLASRRYLGGLFHAAICSDALDMRGTKRGFRFVIHDLFGTCVERPRLDEAFPTRKKAEAALEAFTIDAVAHYTEALKSELRHATEQAANIETALGKLTTATV